MEVGTINKIKQENVPKVQYTDRDPESKSCMIKKHKLHQDHANWKTLSTKQEIAHKWLYRREALEEHLCYTCSEAQRASLAINYSMQSKQQSQMDPAPFGSIKPENTCKLQALFSQNPFFDTKVD